MKFVSRGSDWFEEIIPFIVKDEKEAENWLRTQAQLQTLMFYHRMQM